jgi:REP element-mobilizing transposase RayT
VRVVEGLEPLASERYLKIIRRAVRDSHKGGFRICEFNVLGNHVHLVTEAAGKEALASGVAGFEVRVARRINAAMGRRGTLFPDRYHARYLKTPTEVRNALRYVLMNRKHHAAEKRFSPYWIDPCSSATWFDGWAQPIRGNEPWQRQLLALERPTAKATVWLLTTGWKRHGLLRFDERPG